MLLKFMPASTLGMFGIAVAPDAKITLPDKLGLSNWAPVAWFKKRGHLRTNTGPSSVSRSAVRGSNSSRRQMSRAAIGGQLFDPLDFLPLLPLSPFTLDLTNCQHYALFSFIQFSGRASWYGE